MLPISLLRKANQNVHGNLTHKKTLNKSLSNAKRRKLPSLQFMTSILPCHEIVSEESFMMDTNKKLIK